MGNIPQAEFNAGSPVRRAAPSGSGTKSAQGPDQKQKFGGHGGRRGHGAGDTQSEVSAVDSLIAQLPAGLQGAYQSSLQSIMSDRGADRRSSLQSLQAAIQDTLDMLNADPGGEGEDHLPETGGMGEGGLGIAQVFRGAKSGGGLSGVPPTALAEAGRNAAPAPPPPAFTRLTARA